MRIVRSTSRTVTRGSPEFFAGTAWVEMLKRAEEPSRVRTAWHTHTLGQLLIVVQGIGVVQEWGGEAEIMGAGDVVWTPLSVKHWYGATDTHFLAHVGVQEILEGGPATPLELVTDEQYEVALELAAAKLRSEAA